MDKSEGGVHLVVHQEVPRVDPCLLHGFLELAAELVLAHLADKGSPAAKFGEHGEHITGRAPGIGLQQRISLFAKPVFGKVDQKLAYGDHVVRFHFILPPDTARI